MPRNRTPIREQYFRIAAIFVVPAVVAAGVTIGFAALRGREDLGVVVFVTLAVTVPIMIAGILVGLYLGRRLVGDRIELAFRRPGEKWRHARVDVAEGRVRLQPYLWQVRVANGDPLEMAVERLDLADARKPPFRSWWSLNPQLRIVDLDTDRGRYEIAALPSHLAELRERLHEASPTP